MAIVTGDRYLESLVRFVERRAGPLLEGSLTLRLNPAGLHYVQSRLDALQELEGLLAGAPVDYLRAYVSDLGDHRALEQLRRILGLLTSLKVISVLPPPARDPTPLSLVSFGSLKVLELRGCDLSTSAAKGLLELRGSLEKLICHNSTDALRHVFASRIADIKGSPVWKRLSFVSCACNSLVLMDESLQLIPVVETLDLSRNRFAKLDNLQKCTKLRHLDLGFNHLRTIALLSEVSCPIVKLVLRNNALATLHGIENLKSVQGLDLSYNVISSFSELEILSSLSCLQSIWLEGNPVCCARWYRSHVYSFFSLPEKVRLDDRGISTKEYWERHIILASKQQRPAGYGFYIPAKHDTDNEGSPTAKRKKNFRLASIKDDEQRCIFAEILDQESASCDSDNTRKDDNTVSDGESEIINLMNRVECLKKERSVIWLREFKEWMDQSDKGPIEGSNCMKYKASQSGEMNVKQRKVLKHLGESSMNVQDLARALGGESSSNLVDSDMSFIETYNGVHDYDNVSTSSKSVLESPRVIGGSLSVSGFKNLEVNFDKHKLEVHLHTKNFFGHGLAVEGSNHSESKNLLLAPLTVIDDIMGSRSSSTLAGSPPQYKEDILHRRLNLEEEFWQQSAESLSLASSDSDTSCSDDDSCRNNGSRSEIQESSRNSTSYCTSACCEVDHHDKRCESLDISYPNQQVNAEEYLLHDQQEPFSRHPALDDTSVGDVDQNLSQNVGSTEKRKGKHRVKRRIISLVESFTGCNNLSELQKSNGILKVDNLHMDTEDQSICAAAEIPTGMGLPSEEATVGFSNDEVGNYPTNGGTHCLQLMTEASSLAPERLEIIMDFFHMKVADSETCDELVLCDCIFQFESAYQEREVAVVRSSKSRFYMLLVDDLPNGRGTLSRIVGCHGLEDIRRVVLGLGLQTLRMDIEGNVVYLFLTRTIEKARDLLHLLQVFDSTALHSRCSLQSWEQIQVMILEKHVCRDLKISILFYAMLLFHSATDQGRPWCSRSLFIIQDHMVICVENLVLFSCSSEDVELPPSYYSIDTCCSIQDILEVEIEHDSRSVTLTLDLESAGNVCSSINNIKKGNQRQKVKGAPSSTWKLKWYSEDALWKFIALIKAIHTGLSLVVKCTS